jgi:small-conductance mechanosensitive channel
MSDGFIGWQDSLRLFSEPMFSVGGSQISLARLAAVAFAMVLAWWIARMAERALRRFGARRTDQLSGSAAYALGRITRYVLLGVGLLIALSLAGINFASVAVVGGALGLGVGIGLQPLFANFVSGIVLLLDRTLKVGDFVDLQSGVRGRVVEIAMRYTRVSTNDSVDVLVPNAEFVNGRVTNWTFDDRRRRLHIPFNVAYGSDKNLVREAGVAAATRIEGVLLHERERDPDVWLVGFGDNALNFELVVWVDWHLSASPSRTQAQLLWALEDELSARGLVVPFPQRDLHVQSGTLRVKVVDDASAS